jgi:predicted secreted protein
MKSHHIVIVLCIVCLIAAFSAGCTQSKPASATSTPVPAATPAAKPVSPAAAPVTPTAVVTKPAKPVAEPTSPNGYYTLTESEDKGYYIIPKDGTVYVTLDENPTTGYIWNLTASPGITIVKSDYLAPSSSQGAGAGGLHEWEIKAIAKGDQKISAILKNPSEPTSGLETTYTVFLSVE